MYYILMMAASAVAVVSSSPVTPCSNMMDMLSKCLSDNGFNQSDIYQYTQGTSFDPETIKKQCSQLPEYLKAYECITSEFSRCPITGIQFPTADQTNQTMVLLCNDPNINFTCITQAQQSSQIQSCIRVQLANRITTSQTWQQTTCQTARVGFQCVIDLVSKCDAHTGSVMAQISQVSASAICGEADSR